MGLRRQIKAFLPHTLFGRSLVIMLLPILLFQVFITFMFFERHWNRMTERLSYAVSGEIALVVRSIEELPEPEKFMPSLKRHMAQNLDMRFAYDSDEELDQQALERDHGIWERMVAKRLSEQLTRRLRRPFLLRADFDNKWVEVHVQLEEGVLYVSFPQNRLFSSSAYIFLLWMVGTSFFLTFIAVLFMRNQIRPIRRLARAADRFGKGHEVNAFKPEGAREVRLAGRAFLDMRRRITRQIEQRTAMLAGISHDLRTPLTRMKLQLAMVESEAWVSDMQQDIQDMEKMIGGYLDFVRGESDEEAQTILLQDMVDKITRSYDLTGKGITVDIVAGLQCEVKPMAFERCLQNIIGNALNHGQHLWVSAYVPEHGRLEILIEDDGPGIPENLYDEIFKPFFRVDSARNLDIPGTGLGLSIAMDVVHAHGGRIWAEKSRRGGAAFYINLPHEI